MASLGPEVEGGANARPSEVAENHENVCLGATLEQGYASGVGVNRCTQLKGCAARPGAAVEGDARGRSSGNP